MMIGSVLRNDPAMTAPYSWLYGPSRVGRPKATGNLLSSVITTSGQTKSFQAVVKNRMPSTAITGVESGRTTRQKTPHSVAPSTRAASKISSGTDSRYWRGKKKPIGWGAKGGGRATER